MENPNATIKEGFYSKLFARFYDPFLESMEQKVLSHHRKKLIAPLHGKILEVGSGTGVNFKLYPKECNVIASEPSEHMLRYANERLRTERIEANIEVVLAGVGSSDLENYIPKEGLDAIVCTLVLCTIPNPELAVESFIKWLKPGGKLIILEHIHADSHPRKAIHNLLNPAWKRLAEGCHLNRDTASMLKDKGFEVEWEYSFTKVMPFYVAVMKRRT